MSDGRIKILQQICVRERENSERLIEVVKMLDRGKSKDARLMLGAMATDSLNQAKYFLEAIKELVEAAP